MEVKVNQSESSLNVQSGDSIRGRILIELFITTTYQIDKHPDLLELKLNGNEVGSRLELGPGKHFLSFSIIAPEVEWPGKRVILSVSSINTEENFVVKAAVFPRNWDELTSVLQISGAVSIFASIIVFLSVRKLGGNDDKKKKIQELEAKNQAIQKHLVKAIGRINSLITWIEDLLQDEPGLYEKALAYPPTMQESREASLIEPIPLSELIDIEDIQDEYEHSEGIGRILVKLGDPLSKYGRGGGE